MGVFDSTTDRSIERIFNKTGDTVGVEKVIKTSPVDGSGNTIPAIATTVTIYNVSTTNGNWTKVADGLTGVLSWRLVDENGADFDYAFTSSPATYMTAFGWVGHETQISEIYVRRRTSTNVDAQLCIWSA